MKILACNLKNKQTKEDALKYTKDLAELACPDVELIFFPSFSFLPLFPEGDYKLGSQDISSFSNTTITGEITGEQLKSLGVTHCLVAHSERRIYKNEINIDFINKINNAQEQHLKVIYCIGETLSDQENGNTYVTLEKQISEVLNNVELKDIIIAYEPVWAIGTGKVPKAKDIKENIDFIKDIIEEKYDTKIKVLYGGSINADNIDEFKDIKGLDGFLVGGASLKIENVKAMLLKLM